MENINYEEDFLKIDEDARRTIARTLPITVEYPKYQFALEALADLFKLTSGLPPETKLSVTRIQHEFRTGEDNIPITYHDLSVDEINHPDMHQAFTAIVHFLVINNTGTVGYTKKIRFSGIHTNKRTYTFEEGKFDIKKLQEIICNNPLPHIVEDIWTVDVRYNTFMNITLINKLQEGILPVRTYIVINNGKELCLSCYMITLVITSGRQSVVTF